MRVSTQFQEQCLEYGMVMRIILIIVVWSNPYCSLHKTSFDGQWTTFFILRASVGAAIPATASMDATDGSAWLSRLSVPTVFVGQRVVFAVADVVVGVGVCCC